MHGRRTLPLGTALLTASLALTACSGDEEKVPQADPAPACGVKQPRTEPLQLKGAADALAAGAAASTSQSYRMVVSQGELSAVQEGTEAYDEDGGLVASELIIDGVAPYLRMLYVDGKYYVTGEGITPQGEYAVIDPENSKDPLAGPMKEALNASEAGPTSYASQWQAGLVAIRLVGEEKLADGTETEHYKFDVDPRLAVLASGQVPPKDLPPVVTWDVWVDEHNLMHRIENRTEGVNTVVTMYGFCEPVEIPVPTRIVERETAPATPE